MRNSITRSYWAIKKILNFNKSTKIKDLLELYDFYAVHNSIMHFAFQPLPVPWQMFFEHTIFSKLVCPICTTVIWTTVKLYEQAQIF